METRRPPKPKTAGSSPAGSVPLSFFYYIFFVILYFLVSQYLLSRSLEGFLAVVMLLHSWRRGPGSHLPRHLPLGPQVFRGQHPTNGNDGNLGIIREQYICYMFIALYYANST